MKKTLIGGMTAAIAAITVAVIFHPGNSRAQDPPGPQAMPASSLPAIASEPPEPEPFVMPIAMAAHQSVDERFLGLLNQSNVVVYDRAAAIVLGHSVCDVKTSHGFTIAQMTAGVIEVIPSLSYAQTRGVVDASMEMYCPQFGGR